MKKLKVIISLLLVVLTVSACFVPVNVSAASTNTNTNYSKYNRPETKGDYAYYKNGKVTKSSSTSTSEVKWMQAALNYCIAYEGLNTSYITVDGSFGPASRVATLAFQKAAKLSQDGSFGPSTIKKMIDVLSDNKKTFSPVTITSNKNILSKCNIVKTYTVNKTKYYMATLKTDYNGVKKGTTVFLNSNYTAVTNSALLENLLFTNAVDRLSQETSGFIDLIGNYKKITELNNVCQKILDAQYTQKIIGSAAGSFAGLMLTSNPAYLVTSAKNLSEEAYVTIMTIVYIERVTTLAIDNSNIVTKYCKDGIASYEEAKAVEKALNAARTAFLIAGTDCMYGLVSGYTNKTSATLNSLKTYLSSMCGTLLEPYGGTVAKIIKGCATGADVLEYLGILYGSGKSVVEGRETFTRMFDNYTNNAIKTFSSTQTKLSK